MKEIEKFVKKGKTLLEIEEPVEAHSQFGSWVNEVANWLNLKAESLGFTKEWNDIGTSILLVGSRYYNDVASWQIFHNVVKTRLKWLEGFPSRLKTVEQDTVPRPVKRDSTQKIFLHGPHNEMRKEVLRFLNRLRLESAMLDGQTVNHIPLIIYNPINYTNVCFGIILISRDLAEGSNAGYTSGQKASFWERALLELGFLLGKLGRRKACLLYEKELDIPFAFEKIVSIQFDREGAWKMILARKMKLGGVVFDMNLLV